MEKNDVAKKYFITWKKSIVPLNDYNDLCQLGISA